jgi:DNA polymerase III epsilon subunit-like protein
MTQLFLPFDTETTGLPSSKRALNDSAQPHLVSCSALQVLDSGRIQQSMSKMVAPYGWAWDMDSGAAKVHGLSPEECATYGDSEKAVLDEFLHLWHTDAHLIAHNLKFDQSIIAIAIARYYPKEAALLAAWQAAPGTCTMQENKERVDARTAKGAKKPPNLKETYEFFTGEPLEHHHSANADAVAVYTIWMHMQRTR